MAVQKSRKSPSKRDMRRAHDRLTGPTLSTVPVTDGLHLHHDMTPNGFYRGSQFIMQPVADDNSEG